MLHSWKSRVAQWIKQDSPGLTLDICCGTGKQCRLIAEHSPVVGLDLDLDLLKFAQSTAPHILFVCADAGHLPFKGNSFKNANISLALHDKADSLRTQIIHQTEFILRAEGSFFIVDFEKPKSFKSRLGYSFIYLIELMAGREHFRNGREFVKMGGLESFVERHQMVSLKAHKSQASASLRRNRFLK